MNARSLIRAVIAALALTASTGATPAARAATITQPELHFHFTAPDHFDPVPPPNVGGLYGFQSTLADGSTLVVSIDKLGGTIDRNRYKPEDLVPSKFGLPANARISLQDIGWTSFTLDALRVELPKDDQTLVVFISQLPLAPEAVQVTVAGSTAHEAEASATFRALVASVDGKSSWLSDADRSFRLGELVGSTLGVGLGLGLYFWLQRRRATAMGAKIRAALTSAESLRP